MVDKHLNTHTHTQRHIYSDVLHEKDSFLSENFLPSSLKTTKHKPKYMACSKLHILMDRILIFKKVGQITQCCCYITKLKRVNGVPQNFTYRPTYKISTQKVGLTD